MAAVLRAIRNRAREDGRERSLRVAIDLFSHRLALQRLCGRKNVHIFGHIALSARETCRSSPWTTSATWEGRNVEKARRSPDLDFHTFLLW